MKEMETTKNPTEMKNTETNTRNFNTVIADDLNITFKKTTHGILDSVPHNHKYNLKIYQDSELIFTHVGLLEQIDFVFKPGVPYKFTVDNGIAYLNTRTL